MNPEDAKVILATDCGSTTTKAVVVDENRNILGRGITNSRSNYDTAATMSMGPVDGADPFLLPRIPVYQQNSLAKARAKLLVGAHRFHFGSPAPQPVADGGVYVRCSRRGEGAS